MKIFTKKFIKLLLLVFVPVLCFVKMQAQVYTGASSYTLNVSPSTATNVQWFHSNSSGSMDSIPGADSVSFLMTEVGVYYATYTDSPCVDQVTPISIMACDLSTVVLKADSFYPSGYTFAWIINNDTVSTSSSFTPDSAGSYTLSISSNNEACITHYVYDIYQRNCLSPDTVIVTPACPTCPIPVCTVGDDIADTTGATYSTCGTPAGYTVDGPDSLGCYTYTPDGTVTDTVTTCQVICNNGVCDTTYIIIYPPVSPDTVVVTPACPTCPIPVCTVGDDIADTTGATYSTCGTPAGYTVDGPDSLGCYTYTPDGTVTDTVTTCQVICNNGVCDTTYIIIYPPVSPDTVVVTPACPTCPIPVCTVGDDIADTTGATYSTCGTPAGYTVDGPDSLGCYTYTPDGTVTDTVTTCQVICNNGVCDTTYIIIYPPVSPDTVVVTPACPTCPIPVCTVGDDIADTTGATYSTCGTPAGYTVDGPDSLGCYTYTPDGTVTDTVTTCQVICNNGVCDTTYIIIYPPVSPDTVVVTPACPTCPIPVCTVGDDIADTTGATYSTCGTPAGYTVDGPDSLGCYTYTPDGTVTDTVTTCQVICNNGVCDTTYIIIYPPVSPDTVVVTPACPTCPVTVCTVGDDIADTTGATYSTCGTPAGYTVDGPDSLGCYTYTPSGSVTSSVTTCQVICNNGVCDTTYIIINPPSIIVNPDINVTNVGVPTSGNLSTNDDIVPGTTYGTPVPGSGNPSTDVPTINADGTYTFTPTVPGVYTFSVPVCPPGQTTNCPINLLTITVLDPSVTTNPPVANTDLGTTIVGNPVTINSLSNDQGGNDGVGINPASVTVTDSPSHGTVSVDPATGNITFTPNAGFVGTDTLTYKVCDSTSPTPICATAIQIITVLPAGSPNSTNASDDYTGTTGTTPATGNALANDTDPEGNTQKVTPQIITDSTGTFTIDSLGNYSFTPAAGFSGATSFVYQVCDNGSPVACKEATIYILVNPMIVNPDINVTNVGVPTSGNLNTNDDVVPGSTYGTPVPGSGNPSNSVPTINADGTYTFTPSAAGVYTFSVPVCPPGQTTNCPTDLLTITVLDPSVTTNPPVANTDLGTTIAGNPVTINSLSNDQGGNDGVGLNPASVTVTDLPSHGTVTVNPATGNITYTPNAGFVGTDTLTYEVCDSTSPTPICATAIQIITVLPVGSPNSTNASDDYAGTTGTTPATGNALANDTDPEDNTQKVTPQTISDSTGTFTIDSLGNYSFTPASGFSGTANFIYKVCDNGSPIACTEGTIYILVSEDLVTLPIKYNNFTVKLNDCKVTLDWMMNGYANTDVLEIKRANNIDRQFASIFTSSISSMTSNNQHYNYVDKNLVENGEYIYQLTVTEADGSQSSSELKIVKFECNNTSIFVYPNPASDNVTLSFNENESNNYILTLIDVRGRIIKVMNTATHAGNNEVKIDLSAISTGNYFLKVMNSETRSIKTLKLRIDK